MKKTYRKPEVILEKEIEALAGTCQIGDGDTGGQDKASIMDPQCNTGNIVT